ncbi:flagellar hook-length control protein FliK [Phenylobacterium sp.]|jgi:Meckel syndrome type 1 protein|uniref:flagellar hook-length control protein FliK n=1 Tax=Phenylobacterium sp. TaxID=1871053 RepID=UPI0037CBD94D
MNASALNAASFQPTGQTGLAAGAGAQGTASGPLAGFEALLAALFPTGPAPTAPAASGAPEGGDADKDESDAPGEKVEINAEVAFADLQFGTANANLLTGVIAVQAPIASLVTTSSSAPSTGDAGAAPRGFASILTAGPPAGASATLATTAEADASSEQLASGLLADGTKSATVTGPAPGSETPEQASANPGAAAIRAPVASISEQALAPRASAQAAAPAPSSTEPASAPSAVATGVSEASLQVAGLQSRPEQPAPAPAPRNSRAERARAASEAAPTAIATPAPPQTGDSPDAMKPVQAFAAATPERIDADESAVSDEIVSADSPDGVLQSESRAASQSLAPATLAGHAVRGSPETVATLAAQIIKKLEGQSTRFDLELNPGGLGKVDVRIDIGAHGRITAAMTFDNPQAASDLKARANELQRAMEQAGFDMSGGMSFDVAGDRGQQQRQAWQEQTDNNGQAIRGQAFRAALDTAGAATDAAVNGALRLRRGVNAGLDLRI